MEADHTSPKYITSCPSCQEICSEIHPSNIRHQTVGTNVLQNKIESILNQNYDQWLGLFEKLQTSIQHLIQYITQYLHKLDQTVNEYRNVLVLNQQQKSKEDQQNLSKAMAKISQFKYNQLTCDQIDKIMSALKQKELKREIDLKEQFELMEDKILFDLHEIVSMNFSCLQNKPFSKIPESFNKYAKKEDKSSKDLSKEIDPTQISKKIQEIMKQQMEKIKPLINQEISKAKTQIIINPLSQQIPKVIPESKQKSEVQVPKNDYWTKIYGNFRDNYCASEQALQKQELPKRQTKQTRNYAEQSSFQGSFDESDEDCSQAKSSLYQRTEGFTRSHADKSETQSVATTFKENNSETPSRIFNAQKKSGAFNCIVKVLVIIHKQMKFGGKICTRFLGGDKTGAAIFMMEHSALLEPGNNVLMESIKWANFNHEKQGQYTKKTKITLYDEPIKVIGTFRLGENTTKLCNDNAKEIQVLIGKEYAKLNKLKKQVNETKKQYVPKEKIEQSNQTIALNSKKRLNSTNQFRLQIIIVLIQQQTQIRPKIKPLTNLLFSKLRIPHLQYSRNIKYLKSVLDKQAVGQLDKC